MAELTFQWQIAGQTREGHVEGDATAVLGRAADATICVDPDNRAVSRHHAQVRRRTDGFAISDVTDGKNPVLVNGRTITTETLIKEGDTVQLGDVTLRVTAVRGIAPVGSGTMMRLRWDLGGQTHDETIIGGDPVVIGRLAPATIVIPSETVSRQHLQIAEKGGRFVLTDLTSGRNPVTVNQRALSGERYLSPGDVIQLGAASVVVTAVQGANQPGTGITELHAGRLVVCPTCHREVEGRFQDCPWCGTALVNAETVLPRY